MPIVQVQLLDLPYTLYCRYDGRDSPQPAHLVLDLDTGVLTCDYDHGSGTPEPVAHQRVRWYPIPHLTAEHANTLLYHAELIAQRILDDAFCHLDASNNRVGVLGPAGRRAEQDLADLCASYAEHDDTSLLVGELDPDEWLGDEDRDDLVARLGLTAVTTDAQLSEIVADEETRTLAGSEFGYTLLRGAWDYLAALREQLREEVRDRLIDITREIARLEDERATLVVQADRFGDSNRRIGGYVGKSHTWVQDTVAAWHALVTNADR